MISPRFDILLSFLLRILFLYLKPQLLRFSDLIPECDQVSRSSSVPPNTRDALYQGLPPNIKSALRSKLLSFQVKEEVSFDLVMGLTCSLI
jgi:hypothetical protein